MILTRSEKIMNVLNWLLLIVIGIICVFPIYYTLSVSITSLESFNKFGFQVIPSGISLGAYQEILERPLIPRAYLNSIIITVGGTILNMVLTVLTAYPLANKRLPGRNFFLGAIVFTLIFSGGLIPLFILVRSLNLMNTYWAVILPGAIWSWNVLILKNFFEAIPQELLEAARIDGANEFQILKDIILPISTPGLATIALFYAVGHWNDFFYPLMFLTDQKLQPLSIVLRQILRELLGVSGAPLLDRTVIAPTEATQMAAVFLSIIPILVVYPFLQRYFTKGILLGSLKG